MADGKSNVSARSSPEEMRERLGVRSAPRGGKAALATRLIEGLKTFLWVGPLTVLIWVYAEREQLATITEVPAAIEVRSNSSDRIVTVISPEDRRVYLDLAGPRASLATARDKISDLASPLLLTIGEEIQAPFEGEIPVADRLAKDPAFTRNAATITRSRPPLVKIRVDRRVTRSAPVKPRPDTKIVGDVVFDPPNVTLDGPEPILGRISADQLVVYADLSKFANKPPGKYDADEALLSFPFRTENVTFPKGVKATITIRQSEPYPVPSIPIVLQLPAGFLENADKIKITLRRPTLPNVNVIGPPEAIQLIKDRKFQPAVILELTPADLAKTGENTKHVEQGDYRMPKDVTVLNPDAEITYTISERGG